MRKELLRIIYLASTLLMGAIVVMGFYVAHNLRPAADDYCYGSITAEYGFYGGIVHWLDTWSGFVLSVVTGSLFVGAPLAYLPFDVASAIPFIAVALGMGITINFLTRDISSGFIEKLMTIVLVAFGWWTYLWSTPNFNHHMQYSVLLANGLTFWQTLNGQYVIQLQILISILFISLRAFKHSLFLSILSGSIIGLISGSAGTTLSLSILIIGLMIIVLNRFLKTKTLSNHIYFWWALCIFLLASVIACHFLFLGNIIRVKALNIHVDTSLTSLLFIGKTTFIEGLKNWAKSYLNHGAILFFLLTCSFYWIRGFQRYLPKGKDVLTLGFLFSIFALVQCFINRLSEFFSYEGYWHFVSPMVCCFISIYFFGVWGAIILTSKKLKNTHVQILIGIFALVVILGINVNIFMFGKIEDRHKQWLAGAAPREGISDIEDGKGWQNVCWSKLINLKGQINPRLDTQKN
jgi:hypothetical protein